MESGRNRRWVVLLCLGALASVWQPLAVPAAAVQASQSAAAAEMTDAEIERFLREARVVKTRSAGKGVTNSTRATLSDGTVTHDAQIQTVDEKKATGPSAQGTELNFRDSWMFNVAAYRLDRLIGLNLVPVSIERAWNGKAGAFTWWVDDVLTDEGGRIKKKLQPPRPSEWVQTMQLIRIFDQLIYNMDRNMGNLLYTNDWRVWAIDHTRAFRLHKDLKTPASVTRCDRQVFEKLKALNREGLEREVGDYLTNWERDAILQRRDAIVEIIEKGGPGALFDRQPATSATIDDLAGGALARIDGELAVPGLKSDVQVVRDAWGVPHIYARSDDDLFFAQGYVAAQDRLWQMEMWRRAAEGRLAEVLGERAVPRDRSARLLKYRGPVDESEFAPYHPDSRRLMTAFVNGVNAFIAQSGDRLPVEFTLTGIAPQPWTVETLLLRQVTFGDASSELQLARSVAELGVEAANRNRNPDPWDDLKIPEGFDPSSIDDRVVASARAGGRVPRPEALPQYRALIGSRQGESQETAVANPGSNNWVVSGQMSATGKPVVANDPHREVALPSLRYIFHLDAPGWSVIGASEPPFFGVAIGHNAHVAWGLTIVGTDQQDVFVEELNPANRNEVKYQGRWEPLRVVREEIAVKGSAPQTIELKFSRHGPIFYEDRARNLAYALKSALHEPGTAPYLAGLRLGQSRNCREFLDAANSWYHPSENLVCGDVDGNISWQASALTPSRKSWTGRLPVPGTGAYEWQGFRTDLPREYNPPRGFIATANHNIQPKSYSPPLMFKRAETGFERIARLLQVLTPGRPFTLDDHRALQLDAHSLRAAAEIDRFKGWKAADPEIERAREMVASWDAVYRRDSAATAVYESWRAVRARGNDQPQPDESGRESLEKELTEAVARIGRTQGADPSQWRWGRMHTRAFEHSFVPAFNLATVERPGGAGTVAADGASYREILDVSDWDRSIATNTPGQSGQPGSPFYGNLLPLWAEDQYFPLAFSKEAVEKHAAHRLTLRAAPAGSR